MRIAHLIHGVGLGGAQQVVRLLVRGAAGRGESSFVYAAVDGLRRPELEQLGALVRILPRHLPKLDPGWAWRLARALSRDRVDLVHTHLFGDTLHGVLAARAAGRLPVVATLHGPAGSLPALQRFGYRRLLPRVAAAVACSESVRRSVVEARWPGAERMTVIANAVDPPRAAQRSTAALRRELGLAERSLAIASFGRLVEQKGHRHLLRAFGELSRSGALSDAVLLLVGEGPLRAELERLAREEGVGDRVRFTGLRDDVPELMAAVDLVVMSSLWEGLSIVLLETMAAGRAIVATAVPGIREAVEAEAEALLVPPGDAAALAAALARAAADPELRRRLGTAARLRFERQFTAERMIDQYASLYRKVIQARSAPDQAARRAV